MRSIVHVLREAGSCELLSTNVICFKCMFVCSILIDSVIDCFPFFMLFCFLFAFLKSDMGLFNDKCNCARKCHKI